MLPDKSDLVSALGVRGMTCVPWFFAGTTLRSYGSYPATSMRRRISLFGSLKGNENIPSESVVANGGAPSPSILTWAFLTFSLGLFLLKTRPVNIWLGGGTLLQPLLMIATAIPPNTVTTTPILPPMSVRRL